MNREQVARITSQIVSNMKSIEVEEPREVAFEGYKAVEVLIRRTDLKRWWSVGINSRQSDESAAMAIGKAFAEAVQAR